MHWPRLNAVTTTRRPRTLWGRRIIKQSILIAPGAATLCFYLVLIPAPYPELRQMAGARDRFNGGRVWKQPKAEAVVPLSTFFKLPLSLRRSQALSLPSSS